MYNLWNIKLFVVLRMNYVVNLSRRKPYHLEYLPPKLYKYFVYTNFYIQIFLYTNSIVLSFACEHIYDTKVVILIIKKLAI